MYCNGWYAVGCGGESQDFLHKEHRKQQAASSHKLANL
jgi:hypothetical protein